MIIFIYKCSSLPTVDNNLGVRILENYETHKTNGANKDSNVSRSDVILCSYQTLLADENEVVFLLTIY